MKKLIAWFNRPWPCWMCEAAGKGKDCKTNWPFIILITTAITLVLLFGESNG